MRNMRETQRILRERAKINGRRGKDIIKQNREKYNDIPTKVYKRRKRRADEKHERNTENTKRDTRRKEKSKERNRNKSIESKKKYITASCYVWSGLKDKRG